MTGSFSYDLSTDVGRCRLAIPDRDQTAPIFSDEELTSFVNDEGDWRRGAALALEMMAADTAYSGTTMSVGDLRVDGAAMARVLLQRAAGLREQANLADAESGAAWDIAEQVTGPAGYRERLVDQALRQNG